MLERFKEFFSQLADDCIGSLSEPFALEELAGSSVYFWLAELSSSTKNTIFFVTENNETAQSALSYFEMAKAILGSEHLPKAFFYPDPEPRNLLEYSPGDELREAQGVVQNALLYEDRAIVFCSASALFRRTIGAKNLRGSRLCLASASSENAGSGEFVSRISIDELCERLVAFGYAPESIVTRKGEFARRGGIVDVFPFGSYYPVRVDFFGEEIEEIKSFDPLTQKSVKSVSSVTILPKLSSLGAISIDEVVEAIEERFSEYKAQMAGKIAQSALYLISETIKGDLLALKEGTDTPRAEFYLEFAQLCDEFIFDFPRLGSLLIFYEPPLIENETASMKRFWQARFSDWRQNGLTFADFSDYYALPTAPIERFLGEERAQNLGETTRLATHPSILVYSLKAPEGLSLRLASAKVCPVQMARSAGHTFRDIAQTLSDTASAHIIVSQFSGRVKEILEGAQAEARVFHGSLPRGFLLAREGERVALVTDLELFGELVEPSRPEPRTWKTDAIKSERELNPGDYVVHIDYGIGRFAGLTEKESKNVRRVYAEIDYADGEKLFVPVDQVDRLKLYRASGAPKLSSLTQVPSWKKTKEKARKDVLKYALKLLRLYRQRKVDKGYSFQKGGKWMEEFIEGFPYELTPDQKEAWEAVQRDMESPKVMDRLICGEVGFGKTEIALRAAFKACLNGRQALMLCPTTILAEQHYFTFLRRFKPFPFRVEMLSRFHPPSVQRKIVEGVRSGEVDVLISTHRGLSKDVEFPRLGLLIIDEEQRFGVKQKEELKLRYRNIDVLSLTATPIPRTLRMSMVGLMDISLIETPPPERKPVKTYVGEWNEALMKDAVLKELSRGGQVYFLHNRILDIESVARRIEKLIPEAKLGIVHGRLPERKLEEVMDAFSRGEFDLLLATTIIENGLDIPRVNTLIVDAAENLGLAQMHQLRGRVGRSSLKAYSYFFHSPFKALNEDAKERLRAIYSCAYLGAGYEIAQQDLLIRGAGTILGTEQSGTVELVGLDYYFELLGDAVEKLKEMPEEFVDRGEITWEEDAMSVQVDLPLSCYIPEGYIRDTPLRMKFYKRIASAKSKEELDSIREEMTDRFGKLSPEAENLFYIIALKQEGKLAGISAISYIPASRKLILEFSDSSGNGKESADKEGEEDAVRKKSIPTFSGGSGKLAITPGTKVKLNQKGWLRKLMLLDSRITEISDERVCIEIPFNRHEVDKFRDEVITAVRRIKEISARDNL